ncbi:MAG: PorP/SprF family type IX secretion system membrane protein [Saprospiraceae bacterium]|nr:PorP/SprF family type IX secretion system membrane protein [Saprospiraceae bacterium]
MRSVATSSLILALILIVCGEGVAQDQNYTQFYAAPTLLNPALTGSYDGKYRVSTLYRDQWRSSLEVPIKSFVAAVDLRFDLHGELIEGDAFAVGLQFASDQAGPFDLSTNSISGSGAYHKSLDRQGTQVLSAGFQFTAAQRNILYENIVFHDQFNGLDQFSLPTSEDLPENNFSFGDLAVGLNYSNKFSNKLHFYGGGALHHILAPEVSFYANDSDENQQIRSTSKLNRRYSIHGGATIQTLSNLVLSPRIYAASQGQHLEFLVGNMFVLQPSESSDVRLHLGAWIRLEKTFEDAIIPDVLALQAGFNLEKLLIGFSYDIGLSNIVNYGRQQGVLELSVSYFGNYASDDNLCPSF